MRVIKRLFSDGVEKTKREKIEDNGRFHGQQGCQIEVDAPMQGIRMLAQCGYQAEESIGDCGDDQRELFFDMSPRFARV